jgi:hypothetical protein
MALGSKSDLAEIGKDGDYPVERTKHMYSGVWCFNFVDDSIGGEHTFQGMGPNL